MRLTRPVSIVVCSVLTLAALPARGEVDEAKQAYTEGLQAFEEGLHKEAAKAFRHAYELKPSWKLLYNIGQAEAAAGLFGRALQAFEQYLVDGMDEVSVERREEVVAEIQRLRVLVGIVEVDAPDGIEVVIDDFSVGMTPLSGPLRVAAGEHQVLLVENEQIRLNKTITVAGGMTSTVNLENDQPAANNSGDMVDTKKLQPMFIAGFVTTAVGAAGLGLGGYYAYKFGLDNQAYQDAQTGSSETAFDEKEKAARLDSALCITGFAVGGALLATGVTLMIIGKKKQDKNNVAFTPTPSGVAVRF